MEFPHLDDTQFPLLNNVNVYAYKNEFDYTRWIANTKVKLTNVLWNSDYRDVVKFDTNIERDRWFNEHEDAYEVTLKTNHSIPPEGGIKLPIPYDVAVRYNYMVVDIPIMTSVNNPIEYEDIESGVRRWYFFVDEVSNRAPNTTMFNISLDVWTQFQNDIEINYLFLERGHAPVAATDVNTYLANPIENNDYLLTPDVTPTSASVVRKSKYIPFGSGEKWMCIATTLNASMIESIGSISTDPDYTFGNITYDNTSDRDGYQIVVNGYGVGNGENWSNLKLDAVGTAINSSKYRIQNNVNVFALPASVANGLVNGASWSEGTLFYDIMNTCPNFMNSILGIFIVDKEMLDINLDNYVVIANHILYICNGGTERVDEIPPLHISDFDFPERYQRFAKLYTFPYSVIQLTDNEGKSVDVRIENTGNINVNRIAQLSFPYINTRLFFTGINGVGSETYQWKLLNGTISEAEIASGDWFEYCFDHEIPCYALYMDGESAWYLDNFNRAIRGGRKNALVAYHNSVRLANTARENTKDADAFAYFNVDADATNHTTNMANNVNTARANADLTMADNAAKVSFGNTSALLITDSNNEKARALTNAHNLLTTTTAITENHTTAATTGFSNGAAGGQAVGNIILGAAMYGGATAAAAGAAVGTAALPGAGTLAGAAAGVLVGGLSGVVSAYANADAANNSASSVMQANTATAQASAICNANILNATQTYSTANTQLMNGINTYNLNQDNALLDNTTNNTGANNNRNAANTAATMRANGDRTKRVNDANALYTSIALINNAKETLENSRNNMQYGLYDAANAPARLVSNYGGNPTADYMRTRGVQIKVRTMPNAEVRQVGDWFARYGYALEQVWDVNESGLCPMNHFCFWKCRDIWIDDRKSSNNAAITLMATMFERGVTIWNNPEEVGRVSIYDN